MQVSASVKPGQTVRQSQVNPSFQPRFGHDLATVYQAATFWFIYLVSLSIPAKIMLQSNFICSVYQIAYQLQLQINNIGFLYEVLHVTIWGRMVASWLMHLSPD